MAEYYVNTTSGNDSAAGTLAAPWLTEEHALVTAVAGDIINIAGTYVRRLFIGSGGGALAGASLYGPPLECDEFREVPFGDRSDFYLTMTTSTTGGTLTMTAARVAMWDSDDTLVIDNVAAVQVVAGPLATIEAAYNLDTSLFDRGFYRLLMEIEATGNESGAALQPRRRVYVWQIQVK